MNTQDSNYQCRAVYKCRMCGKKFLDASIRTKGSVYNELLFKKRPCALPVAYTTIHEHESASFGIADLIGFQKDGVTDDDNGRTD